MHITLVTIGSRGDLQPHLALGIGLHNAGHDVRLASHTPYQTYIEQFGLEFAPLTGDPGEILVEEEGRLWLESGNNPVSFIRQLERLTRNRIDDMLLDCEKACQGTELILYSALGFPGYHIAEKLGLLAIAAYLQPVTRSKHLAPIAFPPNFPLGKSFNMAGHLFLEQLLWQPYRKRLNQWRTDSLNLSPEPFWGPFKNLYAECAPFIYGFSELVVPRPSDWPHCHQISGYWFMPGDKDWVPPQELADFLAAGPPPIYVGFGSMSTRNPKALARTILRATRTAGQRTLFLTGWGGLSNAGVGKDVLVIESAPHGWLFPRMQAVIHHGGAGTTAAGLRAGVPSIVLPFFGDQPFWGQRVYDLGVGPEPIPLRRLTTEKLTSAIQTVVSDSQMRTSARDLGERIQAEDGVARAVELIEAAVANHN